MIFVTSDWHFSHDREFVYKPRGFNSVEEMNIALVERHNSIVTPEDDVYVLGDLCLGGADSLERNKEFISSMNGKLHIAFGNHCTDSRKKMYAELPNVVETAWAIALKYRKYHFYMSHFPTLTGNLEKESLKQMIINLYGHMVIRISRLISLKIDLICIMWELILMTVIRYPWIRSLKI